VSDPNVEKAKAKEKVHFDEYVYFLIPQEGSDIQGGERFRQEHVKLNPGSKARFVDSIKVARLTERHLVLCLYRAPGTSPDGAASLTCSDATRVADHWQARGEDGLVNTQTLTAAINATCLPAVVKYRKESDEDQGTISLRYA
jgi:hypothetical protein